MKAVLSELRKKWKPRKKDSHKGDYGRIFILAGSKEYSGAAFLAGAAALRAGAGLVTLGIPDAIYTTLSRRQPELILKSYASTYAGSFAFKNLKAVLEFSKSQDVVALGPGLSQNSETQKFVRQFVARCPVPMILDADGLNAFAKKPQALKTKKPVILTPHPGEFLRIFGGKLPRVEKERLVRARQAAKQSGCFIILKGHKTVVASPTGKTFVNPTGNPGMATAGSGDVLTGMLAALLGQKMNVWDAARFGVYLHGFAGDLAAKKKGQTSLIASDLIEFLPQALLRTLSK